MSNRSSTSGASTYRDIGAYWDSHDATEQGEQREVVLDVAIESERRYVAVEGTLSERMRRVADQRGISEEALLHIWIQEKLEQTQDHTHGGSL